MLSFGQKKTGGNKFNHRRQPQRLVARKAQHIFPELTAQAVIPKRTEELLNHGSQ